LKASLFYRSASGPLVLFAIGHTLGFQKVDPRWGVGQLLESMRTIHFDAQGFSRTYWDFYVGFGFFVSVFLLFAAILAWQLGVMSQVTLFHMPVLIWGLAIWFVGVTVLSWMYSFMARVIFSGVITLCLILAAWLSGKTK
jgi:hypothetical protein